MIYNFLIQIEPRVSALSAKADKDVLDCKKIWHRIEKVLLILRKNPRLGPFKKTQHVSLSALQINTSPSWYSSAQEADIGIIKLVVLHNQLSCFCY